MCIKPGVVFVRHYHFVDHTVNIMCISVFGHVIIWSEFYKRSDYPFYCMTFRFNFCSFQYLWTDFQHVGKDLWC